MAIYLNSHLLDELLTPFMTQTATLLPKYYTKLKCANNSVVNFENSVTYIIHYRMADKCVQQYYPLY